MIRACAIPLFVIAGSAVACSDVPTQPELGTGTFLLRAVAGTDLPTPVLANGFGGRYLADTIHFEPRSLALFAAPTIERSTVVELPAGGSQLSTEYIGYERRGDRFTFRLPCPLYGGDCAIGFLEGVLTGEQLEITVPAPFRSPLRYQRVQAQ